MEILLKVSRDAEGREKKGGNLHSQKARQKWMLKTIHEPIPEIAAPPGGEKQNKNEGQTKMISPVV